MNSVQIHLALTHVPVILTIAGSVLLAIALFRKNQTIRNTSYGFILAAGIMVLPVYFSGEGAEEAVEHLPGVSENTIERHEELAQIAMISVSISALVALAGLLSALRQRPLPAIHTIALISVMLSSGLMIETANRGGQIRHTEVNSIAMGLNATDTKYETNKNVTNETIQAENEEDDDD